MNNFYDHADGPSDNLAGQMLVVRCIEGATQQLSLEENRAGPSNTKNSKKVKIASASPLDNFDHPNCMVGSSTSTSSGSLFKKKKRFSAAGCAADTKKSGRGTVVAAVVKKPLFLTDLPLLPLSYVCSKLSLVEREALSLVSPKFASANQMAVARRRRLNVRVDVSLLVNQEGDNDAYDDNFDFASLALLADKFKRLAAAFGRSTSSTTKCNVRAVDFSAPADSGMNITKWGYVMALVPECVVQCLSAVGWHVVQLDLRDTLVTEEALNALSVVLGKSLQHLKLPLGTLIRPVSSYKKFQTSNSSSALLMGQTLSLLDNASCPAVLKLLKSYSPLKYHLFDLLTFLYEHFARLKCVYFYS